VNPFRDGPFCVIVLYFLFTLFFCMPPTLEMSRVGVVPCYPGVHHSLFLPDQLTPTVFCLAPERSGVNLHWFSFLLFWFDKYMLSGLNMEIVYFGCLPGWAWSPPFFRRPQSCLSSLRS